MKIELKSFVTNKAFSQETLCFRAVVCLDDKRAGTVENDGHGGSNFVRIDDPSLQAAMERFIVALPPERSEYGELKMTVDLYFSLLADAEEKRRDQKREAARRAKFSKQCRQKSQIPLAITLACGATNYQYLVGMLAGEHPSAWVTKLSKKHPGAAVKEVVEL